MHRVSLPPSAVDDVDPRLVLLDGSVAAVRIADAGDRDDVRRFFHELSPESRYKRFFTMSGAPDALVERLCDSTKPCR